MNHYNNYPGWIRSFINTEKENVQKSIRAGKDGLSSLLPKKAFTFLIYPDTGLFLSQHQIYRKQRFAECLELAKKITWRINKALKQSGIPNDSEEAFVKNEEAIRRFIINFVDEQLTHPDNRISDNASRVLIESRYLDSRSPIKLGKIRMKNNFDQWYSFFYDENDATFTLNSFFEHYIHEFIDHFFSLYNSKSGNYHFEKLYKTVFSSFAGIQLLVKKDSEIAVSVDNWMEHANDTMEITKKMKVGIDVCNGFISLFDPEERFNIFDKKTIFLAYSKNEKKIVIISHYNAKIIDHLQFIYHLEQNIDWIKAFITRIHLS